MVASKGQPLYRGLRLGKHTAPLVPPKCDSHALLKAPTWQSYLGNSNNMSYEARYPGWSQGAMIYPNEGMRRSLVHASTTYWKVNGNVIRCLGGEADIQF